MEKIDFKAKIIADFEKKYRGKGDDDTLDYIITSIKECDLSYHANGSVISAFFYNRVTVDCEGRHFVGNGGGIGFLGGGALVGDIYTDNKEKLFNETAHYFITLVPEYACVIFCDKDWKSLGALHSLAISVTPADGVGDGKW